MKYCFLLLLPFLFCSYNCKKKDNGPAPATEYFNCYIDGKYWSYKQASYTTRKDLQANYNKFDMYFSIYGDDVIDFPQTIITFHLENDSFPKQDTVTLSCNGCGAYAFITGPDNIDPYGEYYTNDTTTGKIIFTTRKSNLLQGFFNFNGIISNRVIHITNGKFSIKL